MTLCQPASAASYDGPPTPCDKDLSPADVTTILTAPATITQYSMSSNKPGEGCELGAQNGGAFAMVDISGRRGDKPTFDSFLNMAVPKPIPLAGVGDEAFVGGPGESNIPNATERDLYARKGNFICFVELHRSNGPIGEQLIAQVSDIEMASRLGALCTKLFDGRAK